MATKDMTDIDLWLEKFKGKFSSCYYDCNEEKSEAVCIECMLHMRGKALRKEKKRNLINKKDLEKLISDAGYEIGTHYESDSCWGYRTVEGGLYALIPVKDDHIPRDKRFQVLYQSVNAEKFIPLPGLIEGYNV